MGTSTRNFAITLDSKDRNGKIAIRDKVFTILSEMMINTDKRRLRVVTLPSVFWMFEYTFLRWLVKQYPKDEKCITIHGFERDYKLFCVAALKMPKTRNSKVIVELSDKNYQKVKTSYNWNYINAHHFDVFEYLSLTDNIFDFMWIDLTCPIDVVKDKLHHASDHLDANGVMVLSFLKGREREKIDDRITYALNCVPDLELIESIEYFDTVSMINLILKK